MRSFKDYVKEGSVYPDDDLVRSVYCAWCKKHMRGEETGPEGEGVSSGICNSCNINIWEDMLKDATPGTPQYIKIQNKITELKAGINENWKNTVTKAALGAGLALGGIDMAYSPRLPEPTDAVLTRDRISANRVVSDAINKEKQFLSNELNNVVDIRGFLKSYNKAKRNLSAIESYANKHNIRINRRALRDAQEGLEKLHTLSRDTNWNNIKAIGDNDDVISKAGNSAKRMGHKIDFKLLLMDVLTDVANIN